MNDDEVKEIALPLPQQHTVEGWTKDYGPGRIVWDRLRLPKRSILTIMHTMSKGVYQLLCTPG
jgi:hypothetical protein